MLATMYNFISIHAPPRGATLSRSWIYGSPAFQFTPLREGRLSRSAAIAQRSAFQFTPLREGRPARTAKSATPCAFQFTPLREGRPPQGVAENQNRQISIHAPPRGATTRKPRAPRRRKNFNSRPSARGDPAAGSAGARSRFQFTPLREGRRMPRRCSGRSCVISIHAPPRGATKVHFGYNRKDAISIHAPPRGATLRSAAIAQRFAFQFTPLREGRPAVAAALDALTDISIHAPPRGATAKDMQFLQIFCSTLTNQHGLTIVPRNLSRLFW